MKIKRKGITDRNGINTMARLLGICVFVLLFAENKVFASFKQDPPNIVILFMDDLGWTDLACYGNTYYETPNINQLSKFGMTFTDAYATPLCGPSRASLFSGQNVTTHGAWTNFNFVQRSNNNDKVPFNSPSCKRALSSDIITFPELLKKAGYTTGFIGKTHMVHKKEKESFDVFINRNNKNGKVDYFQYGIESNIEVPKPNKREYLSDYLTNRVLDFIDDKKDEKFFVIFSEHLPHTPVQGKPELVEKYQNKDASKSPHKSAEYASMVQTLDTNVGKILNKLNDLNLKENTLIIFASDNGGLKTPSATTNAPLKKGKGFLSEGGIRVPMIVAWDGVTEKGSICNEVVHIIDFFPTIIDIAKTDNPNHTLEGKSLLGLFNNPGAKLNRNAMYWHFPGYAMGRDLPKAKPQSAIRSGDYKLIENLEDNSLELFNLKKDIRESENLAQKEVAKTNELYTMLKKWQKRTNAATITKK